MESLKVGKFIPNFKISFLKLDSEANRDTDISNIEEKKNRLEENGWLMPIVITKNYVILEGQNRYEAAKSIGLTEIPVYIADWVDNDNVDEVRDVIISLNNGNRAWTQWDYIKSYKASKPDYREAYDKCVKFGSTLSNGVVVAAVFGIGSSNRRFKDGNQKLKDFKKRNYLLETSSALVVAHGKNNFPSQTLRTFVLWGHKKDYGLINDAVEQMKFSIKNGDRVADGDLGLKAWLDNVEEMYESRKG